MERAIDILEMDFYEKTCIDGNGKIKAQETFLLARGYIENKLELKLPLSALVLLRAYAEQTTNEWKAHNGKGLWSCFSPPAETKARFFDYVFGLDHLTFKEELMRDKEMFKEYLKIRRDEMWVL